MKSEMLGCADRIQERDKQAFERRGFKVRGLLGQGAFSRVYCVEREIFQDNVFQANIPVGIYACKVSDNIGLLEKEALVMGQLQHSLFPVCHGVWQENGRCFLLMEYVPGRTMEEMLVRRGRFCTRQVALAGAELAEGLRCLHESQPRWLFRDVKPSNIIVRENGRLCLVDFGCVCSVRDSMLSQAGSPGFAAPEQLEGSEMLTQACDVYGLGQTLSVMWGGEKGKAARPGARGKKNGSKTKHVRTLEHLFEACTEWEVSSRLPDMTSVLEILRPLCREMGVEERWKERGRLGEEFICTKNIHL